MEFVEFFLAHFLNTENKTIIKNVKKELEINKHMFNSLKNIKGEIVGK